MTGAVRSTGRLLIAVSSGYSAAVLALTGGTGAVQAGLGLRLDGPPTTAVLAINLAVSFVAAIAAGYLSARLAPTGKIVMTMALLVVVFLGMAVVGSRLWPDTQQPSSYLPLVTLLSVIGVWTGGMIERAIHG